MDQYRHPHESKHSFDEVLNWLDRTGFEFVNSIPKTQPFTPFGTSERLFEPSPRGTRLDHAVAQLAMVLTGGREGGVFVMIGRKI